MARRQRVPRHKEHRRKRNKNPKLSPFQREQKRKKMANQAPISSIKNGSQRDYPVSQRAVMEYLMAKQKRQQEQRQRRQEALQKKKEEEFQESQSATSSEKVCEANGKLSSSSVVTSSSSSQVAEKKNKNKKTTTTTKKEEKQTKKAKKSSVITPVALNEEMAASLARPIIAFKTVDAGESGKQENTVEAIIARKKEKKHRKKAEARRERVREALRETEEKLKEELLSTKGGKKRNRVDAKEAAFERKLKEMQKEKAEAAAKQAAEAKKKEESSETENKKRKRKQISFSEGGEDTGVDAPHKAMRYPNDKGSKKPRDFCELVDVVRYGDRVEAPPVFDALPRADASISRLAKRLESPRNGVASSQKERLQLLSAVSGVGEERRLERLGLGRVNTSASATRSIGANKKLSKEEEMQRLRDAVMGAYRRNKRTDVEARKGVDMNHKFPLFS